MKTPHHSKVKQGMLLSVEVNTMTYTAQHQRSDYDKPHLPTSELYCESWPKNLTAVQYSQEADDRFNGSA